MHYTIIDRFSFHSERVLGSILHTVKRYLGEESAWDQTEAKDVIFRVIVCLYIYLLLCLQ